MNFRDETLALARIASPVKILNPVPDTREY
jgi:hypothetical protein